MLLNATGNCRALMLMRFATVSIASRKRRPQSCNFTFVPVLGLNQFQTRRLSENGLEH
jgi:hypothetical protein